MSARQRLARQQAELVRALGMDAPVPEGFDAGRVRAAAQALMDKRRRLVERTWPALVTALGPGFASRFEAWAREHPMTVEPQPLADGRRFAELLRATGPLPEPLSRALRDFDLRWRLTESGEVIARRGFALRLSREGAARRWRLVLRLPGGRLRSWGMSFGVHLD